MNRGQRQHRPRDTTRLMRPAARSKTTPPPPVRLSRLVVLSGGQVGKAFQLGDSTVIGRGDDVEIGFHDDEISRQHAQVERVGADYVLTDLSSNGTSINGAPVQKQRLRFGDKITLGANVELLFTLYAPDQEVVQQRQRMESIGVLAAGIAHEINTPMQFIGGGVQFLQEAFDELFAVIDAHPELAQRLDENTRADLEYVRGEVPETLTRTLEGINQVASIVSAMKRFSYVDHRDKEPFDLNAGIASTLIVARHEYKYVAEVRTSYGDVPLVVCNGGDINQVFLNLLVNAAHAIADSGRDGLGNILITTERDGDHVTTRISDDGIGIDPTIGERIFDPFFTTKAPGKGTGQGLALARSILVDQHGGDLSFETEPGGGTTFTVKLPIQRRTIRPVD